MNADDVRIVPAGSEHLPEVVVIDHLTLGSKSAEQVYRDELEREFSRLDLLILDESVIGFVNYWLVSDEVHLLSLATHPDHQRCGYGLRLMQRLLAVASDRSSRCVTLEVRRSNVAAIALYERLGFEHVAVRAGYYADDHEDALVMLLATQDADSG